ncbi:MAG: tRNA (adenosine(37)-N6)-threonylcarbamoyltransferase complex ATPase subunit type 1 TsaE [Bacillota bacterium]
MELPLSLKVYSEEDTIKLAEDFATILKAGDIVAFNGELGAGKTFFIKNLLKKFGIEYVNSPTFSIVNEYSGTFYINHFDFYRINRIEELYDIGFEEYLIHDNSVTLIEWADMLPEVLPSKRIEINFKVNEDFSRDVEIKRINKKN